MHRLSFFVLSTLISLVLIPVMSAQAQTPRMNTVNISAESDKVHISAEGDVSEMRVDVADEQGDAVFQSGAITGQQLDWNMKDAQGERVAAGTYLVTITFRNAAGKLRKRVEQVTVEEAEKSGSKAGAAAPEAVQVTVTTAGTPIAGRIAKFQNSSQITSSIIAEKMGTIGIGTSSPEARLDVRGTAPAPAPLLNVINSGNGDAISGATGGEGRGLLGISGQGTAIAGYSTNGDAVYGDTEHGRAVFGKSGTGTAVRGEVTSNVGFAGYFMGKVRITGNLDVRGGCFGCNAPSDRNLKANFSQVNPRFILDRLSSIPIQSWNYKSEPETVRHVGAMAQDFRAAFNLGADDKTLNTVDAQGVTMAAIQGLYQMMQEKDQQIEQLQSQVVQLQRNVKQRTIRKRRALR